MCNNSAQSNAPLRVYLRRRGFTNNQIDAFFGNPDNWPWIANRIKAMAASEAPDSDVIDTANTPIENALSYSVATTLIRWRSDESRLRTIGDVAACSEYEIKSIPDIDRMALKQIKTALGARDLWFKENP